MLLLRQCPSFSIVGDSDKPVKDYSDLINPRVLPSDIMAVEGVEDTDTLDLSAKPSAAAAVVDRPRSLDGRSLDLGDDVAVAAEVNESEQKAVMGDGNDGIRLKLEAAGEKAKDSRRRRRRDAVGQEVQAEPEKVPEDPTALEQQFPDVQSVSTLSHS